MLPNRRVLPGSISEMTGDMNSKERELSETLKHSTEGSNEYIYNYKGGSQTVTVNINQKGRLRMIGDGNVIPPSSHRHAGKLE